MTRSVPVLRSSEAAHLPSRSSSDTMHVIQAGNWVLGARDHPSLPDVIRRGAGSDTLQRRCPGDDLLLVESADGCFYPRARLPTGVAVLSAVRLLAAERPLSETGRVSALPRSDRATGCLADSRAGRGARRRLAPA